jgi:hypothetical protein
MTTDIRPPRIQLREMGDSPSRTRYWDPRSGTWTGGLPNGASQERFFLVEKGFMLRPPGRLAIYRNPLLVASRNAKDRKRAMTLPCPTGLKTTVCDCLENCNSWEEHYGKRGLEIDHFEDEEKPKGRLSTEDISEVVAELEARGLKLVQAEEEVGTDDNPGEIVAQEAYDSSEIREQEGPVTDFFAESGERDVGPTLNSPRSAG